MTQIEEPSVPAQHADLLYSIEATAPPRMRGWLHFGAAPLALLLGLALLVVTPEQSLRLGVAVYVATTVLLFGVSAAYHLGAGGGRARNLLRRSDHANIYVFIAGSYTPFAVALGDGGPAMLALVWSIAVVGLAARIFWREAPRWLGVTSYIGIGWVALLFLPSVLEAFGWGVIVLMALGGVLYTLGGVIYARKRPDPHAGWFGFHELFHALTIAAFLLQFAAVTIAVT